MKSNFAIIAALFAVFTIPVFSQIQPGRAVQISILQVPPEEQSRINTVYPVSESGNINMPFIGSVRAAGLRSEDLANVLAQRYKAAEIYTDPVFHVIDSNAKRIEEQVVYIGGDVKSTGPKPYNRNLTLYQAIQSAGGETEFGAINRISVFRDGKRFVYDLRDPKHMNVVLQPNDTIDVPRKNLLGF